MNAENSAGMGNVWPGTGMLRRPSRTFSSYGNGRSEMWFRVMQSDVERRLVCIGWFPLQGKVKLKNDRAVAVTGLAMRMITRSLVFMV